MSSRQETLLLHADQMRREVERKETKTYPQWVSYWSVVIWYEVTTDRRGYANSVCIKRVIAALKGNNRSALVAACQRLWLILRAAPTEIERWHETETQSDSPLPPRIMEGFF